MYASVLIEYSDSGGGGHVMAPCVFVLSRVLLASHLLLILKLDFCKFIKLQFLSDGDGDLYHLNQPKGVYWFGNELV